MKQKEILPFVPKSPFRLQRGFLQEKKIERTLENVLKQNRRKEKRKTVTLCQSFIPKSPFRLQKGVPARKKDRKNVRKRS